MQVPSGSLKKSNPSEEADEQTIWLRIVARRQRDLIYFFLAMVIVYCLLFAAVSNGILTSGQGEQFIYGCITIAELFFVVRLAKPVGKSPVMYAVLMFVPCVSLVSILLLVSAATKTLQECGVKVGLLGADPNKI